MDRLLNLSPRLLAKACGLKLGSEGYHANEDIWIRAVPKALTGWFHGA